MAPPAVSMASETRATVLLALSIPVDHWIIELPQQVHPSTSAREIGICFDCGE
jgi:hypothetical protein